MTNEANSKDKTTKNEQMDTSTADRGIMPAEVAARMDREGGNYRKTAEEQANPESINVTGGATIDQEGLANNFAVEPEMYYEEPGDARQQEEADAQQRAQVLDELKRDKQGDLTMEGDSRGKGPGVV